MPVSTQHPDYTFYSPVCKYVRDACGGEPMIKKGGVTYLPAAFAKEFPSRYDEYKSRAYFMGFTARTKKTFIGMVRSKPPTVDLPGSMKAIIENIDGCGNSLESVAMNAVDEMLQTNIHFLLADYPAAPKGIDAEHEKKLGLRPFMLSYPFESVINLSYGVFNGKKVLELAVLVENVRDTDDEFDSKTKKQYRVLRLREGVYTQQIYNDEDKPITNEYTPIKHKNHGGGTFDHIPLSIAGSWGLPPLYDIARINVGHYQNTANAEESGFMLGNPILHINIGETPYDVWKNENPNGVEIGGSRRGLVTVKGGVDLAQIAESDFNVTLMDRKEAQAAAIGGQLITRGGQAETAEAARINAAAEASELENIVMEVSDAVESCLEDMALFSGDNPDDVFFALNKSFWQSELSSNALQAVMAAKQGSVLATKDVLYMIRQGRVALDPNRTDEEIMVDAASETFDGLQTGINGTNI